MIYILETVQLSTEAHGGTKNAMTRTLMDYTLQVLILRTQMELIGKLGMETFIH